MEEVERRYQCVMVAAVQTVDTVAHGLRVLNVFKPLAARKSLFSVFYVMIDHVRLQSSFASFMTFSPHSDVHCSTVFADVLFQCLFFILFVSLSLTSTDEESRSARIAMVLFFL